MTKRTLKIPITGYEYQVIMDTKIKRERNLPIDEGTLCMIGDILLYNIKE